MTALRLAAGFLFLLAFVGDADAQPTEGGQATPRETSDSKVAQRRWRLNGLGVSYQTKRELSLDAGYRAGLGGATNAIEPQRGFFLGVKKRF